MSDLAFAMQPRLDVETVIDRANELILLAAEHRQAPKGRKVHLRKTMSQKLDALIEETLPDTDHVPDVCRIFGRHYSMTAHELNELPTEVMPLAVVRELFSTHRVVFNLEDVPVWERFTSVYRDVMTC